LTRNHRLRATTTPCLKNVPPLACYNFDTRERIFFGRNATNKVSNQTRFNMPPQITCASALPDKTENTKIAFFTCWISALPEFSLCFISWLTTHNHAAVWLPQSCIINVFSSGLLAAWRRKKSKALQQLPCCMHKAAVRCLLGFLFRKVMLKHQISEVGSSDFLPSQWHFWQKLSQSDRVCQYYSKVKGGTFSSFLRHSVCTTASLYPRDVSAGISCRRVSVRSSVCHNSQVGVLLKRLNVGSRKQRHTGSFWRRKFRQNSRRGHPQRRRQMQVG